MGVTIQSQKATTLAGEQFVSNPSCSGERQELVKASVPASAATGTLTTRSSNSAGTLTLVSGHGITTSAVVDLYWSGGSRAGVTVGTVSGTSVPISGGSGGNLPTTTTAVVVMVAVAKDIDFVGDDVQQLLIQTDKAGRIALLDSAGSTLLTKTLGAGEVYDWHAGCGEANPLAGTTVASATMSHGDAAAVVMRIGTLLI